MYDSWAQCQQIDRVSFAVMAGFLQNLENLLLFVDRPFCGFFQDFFNLSENKTKPSLRTRGYLSQWSNKRKDTITGCRKTTGWKTKNQKISELPLLASPHRTKYSVFRVPRLQDVSRLTYLVSIVSTEIAVSHFPPRFRSRSSFLSESR